MSKRITNNLTTGFTLVELMIAMTVSSIILLAATAGFVQVSRMYRHGVAQANTQELMRNTIESISRPLQFSSAAPVYGTKTYGGVTVKSVCIDSTRFSYALGMALSDTTDTNKHLIQHVLWQDTTTDSTCTPLNITQPNPSSCASSCQSDNTVDDHELLAQNTRLTLLDVTRLGSSSIFNVSVRALYGDDSVLDNPAATPSASAPNCSGGFLNAQACAVSQLTTQVEQRL